jgi:hypothetical protein
LDRGPQLVEQPIALYDVAIGAKIYRVDGRINGGYAGDQEEDGCGRNLFAIAQKFDAIHVGHANVGDNDVEYAGSHLALCRLAAGRDFDFVTFFSKADLEKFAYGWFVVDDQ